MPEKNTLFKSRRTNFYSQDSMPYSCAMLIISNRDNICRRMAWGETATHIYTETCDNGEHMFFHVNHLGSLSHYIPSIEDLLAKDWVVL